MVAEMACAVAVASVVAQKDEMLCDFPLTFRPTLAPAARKAAID